MTRVAVTITAVAVAMLGLFSTAHAQYEPEDPSPRASTFHPTTPNSGAFGFQDINPSPGDGPAAGGDSTVGGTGGGLAVTGVESNAPAAIGIALLAVGGTAVVASRKRQ